MHGYGSNEEFFDAVRGLISELRADGRAEAGARLEDGFGCLNGLTDGAASFLEAVEELLAGEGGALTGPQLRTLREIRGALRRAVYRR